MIDHLFKDDERAQMVIEPGKTTMILPASGHCGTYRRRSTTQSCAGFVEP